MNWFRQNKFLGGFLVAFAIATILCGYFLLHEKGLADEQQERLEATANELNRLRATKPFPSTANLEKARGQAESYRSSLGALEAELKARTLPAVPLQPNEFQAQLRQAVTAVNENAAAAKVKLPPNFYLGFDEYATSLPNSAAAPLLGQELQAIAMLVNGIVNAHVDGLTSLARTPLPEEKAAGATPTPTPGRGARPPAGKAKSAAPPPVSTHAVEIVFSASPTATRKVLNQIATAREQLFIIRTLNVKNQVDKGPGRSTAPGAETATTPPPEAGANGTPAPAAASVHFIVGAEHLDTRARIEIVSLVAPETEAR